MKRDVRQDLTSHIEGGLAVERVVLAEVIHGHGAAAIDGEVHHLVEGDQLNGVELPVVDRFGTGRKWKRGTHPREWASAHPRRVIAPVTASQGDKSSGRRPMGLNGLWSDASYCLFLRPREG